MGVEACSEPSQTSKIELFTKIGNILQFFHVDTLKVAF